MNSYLNYQWRRSLPHVEIVNWLTISIAQHMRITVNHYNFSCVVTGKKRQLFFLAKLPFTSTWPNQSLTSVNESIKSHSKCVWIIEQISWNKHKLMSLVRQINSNHNKICTTHSNDFTCGWMDDDEILIWEMNTSV